MTGGAVLEDGDGIDLVQCFDPKANAWKELQPMLIPRSGSPFIVPFPVNERTALYS